MNNLNKRIKSKRKAEGLTQSFVGKFVGVSQASIAQWEQGVVTPRGANLIALANALNCDPNWLLTGQNFPSLAKEPSNVEPGPELQGAYPVISWVQAGDWSQIHEINRLDADHYPCPVKCSKNTFILKVSGMSMSPLFAEGELIFVDPDVNATSGKYVIARLDDENEATFKQLIIESGHKFLKASNPDWPVKIQPINGNCTIVGVVISAMRLF